MKPDRWAEISPLLDELLELNEDEQRRRLAQIALDRQELAWELQRLLGLGGQHDEFMSSPIMDPEHFGYRPGQHIGPYRLDMLLGEGGMGQVWLAYRADGLYERKVALKLLRPGLADVGLQLRFQRERQVLARLEHPNIARLIDAGISKRKQPYLALEYVDGMPITRYAEQMDLSVDARLALFLQIGEAVSHAHSSLVIHRDLKPNNILVTMLGDVRLLDFGIAKLLDESQDKPADATLAEQKTFTLHYAAPEQIQGEITSTMTDVYALGVVLYELLTGAKPYRPSRDTDAAWEEAILHAEPMLSSQAVLLETERDVTQKKRRKISRQLRGDLDNILRKALAKNPADRYSSVNAMALDIERYQQGQMVSARAPSLMYGLSKYVRRHALAIGTFSLIGAVLLSSLATLWLQGKRVTAEADRAHALQVFLIGLFENAEGQAYAGALDVNALLDTGESQANRELLEQPLARAEVLGLIARLRVGLHQYETALAMLAKQQSIIETLEDQPEPLVFEAATLRSRIYRALGQTPRCLQELADLGSAAQAAARAHPVAVGSWHAEIGRCLLEQQPGLAAEQFDLAARQFERGAASLDLSIQNEIDIAKASLYSGQGESALNRLYRALDRLRAANKETSAQGVMLYETMAMAFAARGARRDQEDSLRRSVDLAVARFGNQHQSTVHARAKMALALSWQQPGLQADSQLALTGTDALLNTTAPHAIELDLELARASVLLAAGRLGEAKTHLYNAELAAVNPGAVLACLKLEAALLANPGHVPQSAAGCHSGPASSVDFMAYSGMLLALMELRQHEFEAARQRLQPLLTNLIFLVGEKDQLTLQARILLINAVQSQNNWAKAAELWVELHAQLQEQIPSAEAWIEIHRRRAEFACAAPAELKEHVSWLSPPPSSAANGVFYWRAVFRMQGSALNCVEAAKKA